MRENKMLFSSLLLLLFATYSCAVEEMQPETKAYSSKVLKNVNPVFLEHDLSAFKIKPVWDSFITFGNDNAVEVNFAENDKILVPMSENQKIQGRRRLLLTLKDGVVNETILEYIPSDNFTGNMKEINSSNFKAKQFDGKIVLQNAKSDIRTYWYLTNGKITAKGTTEKPKTKKNATANRWVETSHEECDAEYYIVTSGDGEGVSHFSHFNCQTVYSAYWVDDEEPFNPYANPGENPYDCANNNSWPWCQNGGGDGDGDGTPSNNLIINDQVLKNNPCLNEVYSKLGQASGFDYYLKNFDGNNSVANLKFAIGTLGGNTYGETSPPNSYLITITFDADKLGNTPSLFVADIFIHEIIHAEMFRKMMEAAESGNIDPTIMTTQQQIDYVESLRNNFPGLYDYYMRYEYNVPSGQEPSNAQHELMAQHYINTIVSALKQYDNTQTEDVYNAIAWFGLKGTGNSFDSIGLLPNSTKAWEDLSTQQRLNLIQTLNNFLINSLKCQN